MSATLKMPTGIYDRISNFSQKREMCTMTADKAAGLLCESFRLGHLINTESSYPLEHHANTRATMVQIGNGIQGAVYEQSGRAAVLKKEHRANARQPTNLKHEFATHTRIWNAFQQYGDVCRCRVSVPRPLRLIDAHEMDTDDLALFPGKGRRCCRIASRADVLEMERVLPMSKAVREALLVYFYGDRTSTSLLRRSRPTTPSVLRRALDDTPNKHCLVRVILGREGACREKKQRDRGDAKRCSLRNFPIFLTDLDALGLFARELAEAMGAAYAVLHWAAGVAPIGVEFMLGTTLAVAANADADSSGQGGGGGGGWQRREVGLHVLDFGRCVAVDLTRRRSLVYRQLMIAMVAEDGPLNVPCQFGSPEIFQYFRRAYVRAGDCVLRARCLSWAYDAEEFMCKYETFAARALDH